MTLRVDTFTAPAHWASYLVNGDSSGLNPDDIRAADSWLASIAPWRIVSDVEDSERFTWSYRLHGGTAEGGSVLDYVAHAPC